MSILFSSLLFSCVNHHEAAEVSGATKPDESSSGYSSSLLYTGQERMYALPGADQGIGQREKVGALTWEHIGAARFAKEPKPWDEPVWDDGQSTHEPFYGMHKVDAQGRLWKVVDVDRPLLDRGIAQYDLMALGEEMAFQQVSGAVDSGEPDTGVEDAVEDTEGGWFEFESFTQVSCTSSTTTNHVWDQGGQEDVIVTSEMNTYETDPIVAIDTYWHGGCSGVLVRSDVVLSAAHCFIDSTGAFAGLPSSYKFCTRGNWEDATPDCSLGSGQYVNPSVNDDEPSAKHDWVLIELEDAIGGSDNKMYFSSVSSATIRSSELYLGGYPTIWRSDPSCISNWREERSANTEYMEGSRLHLAEGEAATVYTKSLRLNVTHGNGYSGGPYFYDPGDEGGRRYVVGVHSSNNPPWNTAAGARASYWRSEWISVITDGLWSY
ncbi:MAG: trypsin-like serine protease [Myxococcota bacterium]|nr:trypsin-like serine protease [Myxococcota bacterium]